MNNKNELQEKIIIINNNNKRLHTMHIATEYFKDYLNTFNIFNIIYNMLP